jgi:hypothetical protein
MSNQQTTKAICVSNQGLQPQPDGTYLLPVGRLGIKNIRAVTFKTFTIRNVFPNVVGSGLLKNNIFSYTVGGTPYTETVPEGFYTMDDLIDVLEPLIQATLAASGIVPLPTLDEFKYEPIQMKFSMTFNGNGASTVITLDGDGSQLSINTLMGNTGVLTMPTNPAVATLMEDLVNMGGVDTVCVCCEELANSNTYHNGLYGLNTAGRLSNCIQMVPLQVPFGAMAVYNSLDVDADSIKYFLPVDATQLTIAITDMAGNMLDLSNTQFNIQFIAYF